MANLIKAGDVHDLTSKSKEVKSLDWFPGSPSRDQKTAMLQF